MSLVVMLILTPPLMLVSAFVVAIPLTIIDMIDEWWERRKRRKYLLSEYRKWYDKAKSCDDFGGGVDKARAVAMLIVIGYELKQLEKKKTA